MNIFDGCVYSRKEQDQYNRKAFERLSNVVINLEAKIHLLEAARSNDRVSLEHKFKEHTWIKNIPIKEALQHLINCLNITYSPDKFNHD
jgi:hypothetical protein